MASKNLLRLAAAVLSGISGSGLASAQPGGTSFLYYNVNGASPFQIYQSILSRGPRAGDALSIATTTARTRKQIALSNSGGCGFSRFHMQVSFVTRLPRLASTAGLNGGDLQKWQSFMGFVQRHEQQHRTIWMRCYGTLEQRLQHTRAGDCGALTRQADAQIQAAAANCAKAHVAFDAQQRGELMRQPFMLSAFRRAAK